MTDSTGSKKKRFRPKKFISKIFGGNKLNKEVALRPTSTLDTAGTYEPPNPTNLSVPVSIAGAPSVQTASVATVDKSVPSLSVNKNETVRDVIQAKLESPRKQNAVYSQEIPDWGDFTGGTDEVPFDERVIAAKANPTAFYEQVTSNIDGDVEIEGIYEDLEHRQQGKQYADRIPMQITVESKPVHSPVKVAVIDLSTKKEKEPAQTEPVRSGLRWVVLSDGNVDMREEPDAEDEMDPPRFQPKKLESAGNDEYMNERDQERRAALRKAQEHKRMEQIVQEKQKMQQEDRGKMLNMPKEKVKTELKVEEEKKEESNNITPKLPVKKSRTTSPAPTPSDIGNVRRITSLSSNVQGMKPNHDPGVIIDELEKQEEIHRTISTREEPAAFRSDGSFLAVPEVGDEINSLDGSYLAHKANFSTRVLETDEGTEMLPSFDYAYPSLKEDEADSIFDINEARDRETDEDDDDDEDDEERSFDENDGEDENERDDEDTIHAVSQEEKTDSLIEVHHPSPGIISKVDDTNLVPKHSSHEATPWDEEKRAQSSSSNVVASQPRRIMGRSRESVEAEQQHGSLTPEKPVKHIRRVPIAWNAIAEDTDDADDEMGTRSIMSSPETVTDTSSYASTPALRASRRVDTRNARTPGTWLSGYTSEGSEEEDGIEDGETVVNIGSELTEMAAELRTKGPGVLIEWMDLRPSGWIAD